MIIIIPKSFSAVLCDQNHSPFGPVSCTTVPHERVAPSGKRHEPRGCWVDQHRTRAQRSTLERRNCAEQHARNQRKRSAISGFTESAVDVKLVTRCQGIPCCWVDALFWWENCSYLELILECHSGTDSPLAFTVDAYNFCEVPSCHGIV